jgi:UDP-glucose:(heptosyl)LPS alpha-1,3-glucosyltransferase
MRIVLVLERFDRNGGGLEQWAWHVVQALRQRGHSVTVLAFYAPEAPPEGVRIHLLEWHESRLRRARAADLALAETGLQADVVHDVGVGSSADILHPQMGSRLANYRREIASLNVARRWLAKFHLSRRRWLREVRQLEEQQYREVSGLVVAVSRMVAADLWQYHAVQPDRIRLVPNGVDLLRFAPPSPKLRSQLREQFGFSGKTVFLFAAHNPRLKGLGPLLQAFSRALGKEPGLFLVVLAKPAAEYRRFVQRHDLQHAVVFPGLVSDVTPWFSAADAFVLPTFYDACSLTVLEACASGLPVITTKSNGASELLTDGREGRIIEKAEDIPALTTALLELANPDVRARRREHALELAGRCGLERNVSELEKVYAEAVRLRTPEESSAR